MRRIVEPIGKPYGCRSVRCGSIQGIRGAAGRYICRVGTRRREIGGIPVKSRGEARGVLRKREPVDKRGLIRPTWIESSDGQGQRGDVTPASKPCDVVRRRIGHRKIRNRLDRCLQTFCTRKPKRCSRPQDTREIDAAVGSCEGRVRFLIGQGFADRLSIGIINQRDLNRIPAVKVHSSGS